MKRVRYRRCRDAVLSRMRAFDAWLRHSDLAHVLATCFLFVVIVCGSFWLFGVLMVESRDRGGPRVGAVLASVSFDQAVGVFFGLVFMASLLSALIAVFALDLLDGGMRRAQRKRFRSLARRR